MKRRKNLTEKSLTKAFIRGQSAKVNGKAKAVVSGATFEVGVSMLEDLGFSTYSFPEYETAKKMGELPSRYIIKDVPYDNLLSKIAKQNKRTRRKGKPRTEFVIHADDATSTNEFPLEYKEELHARLECKWQESSGTTQFKLPYTVVDLHYSAPESKVILLVDGNGYDNDLKCLCNEWCNNRPTWNTAPDIAPKRLQMMDLKSFMDFANRAFGTKEETKHKQMMLAGCFD